MDETIFLMENQIPPQNIPTEQPVTPLPPTEPSSPPVEQPSSSGLMKKLIIAVAVILIIAAIGTGGYLLATNKNAPIQKACTMEAKLCPNGASVGRTGPKCEFSPCPTTTPTSTPDPTANWKIYVDNVNSLTIKYPADWTILPVGSTKIAEQTLREYVTETENALAQPGLPALKIIPPDNDSKRRPVSEHEMIVKEAKNKLLGNVLVTYILKDTITVVTIQAFPSNRSSKDEPFSAKDKETFNKILSTFKFTP